ncbi:MAG: hypothetical protein NTZ97_04265 [Candidatus Moranbacteria bacterium]|nr:hypothetical protein [Candidatus Moranbacteria bacterium]
MNIPTALSILLASILTGATLYPVITQGKIFYVALAVAAILCALYKIVASAAEKIIEAIKK